MRKLIIAGLMLLAFAVSAAGQYRVVRLNYRQVQGQEPKADSIAVLWDDGEVRHRSSSVLPQGPVQFFTRDSPPDAQGPRLFLDTWSKDRAVRYLAALPETPTRDGDTICGHQTALIQTEEGEIHYSRELAMALKIVFDRTDGAEISEAVSIDEQGNFDPRTVDLSGIEEAAAKAEAAGQGDYAKQIRRLVRRWQRAAAKWPN